MKFIVSKFKAENLTKIEAIYIDGNYLMLTTEGGLNAREVKFVYGARADIEALYTAILAFANSDDTVFDCDAFMAEL